MAHFVNQARLLCALPGKCIACCINTNQCLKDALIILSIHIFFYIITHHIEILKPSLAI